MKKSSISWLAIFFLAIIMVVSVPKRTNAVGERMISFSGYDWIVKNGYMGPGPNYWNDSPSAVFVDSQGQLHLKVTRRDGRWHSAEVYLPMSLGYGTYGFDVATPADGIDTNLVAATFLYENDLREFDIEFTNWRGEVQTNAQYVVQPYPPQSNARRFDLNPGASGIHMIYWTPEAVNFSSVQNGQTTQEWRYTGPNNFGPGGERVHINFWMAQATPPSDGQEKELVVRRFTFTPYNSPSPMPAPSILNQQPADQRATGYLPPSNVAPRKNYGYDNRSSMNPSSLVLPARQYQVKPHSPSSLPPASNIKSSGTPARKSVGTPIQNQNLGQLKARGLR